MMINVEVVVPFFLFVFFEQFVLVVFAKVEVEEDGCEGCCCGYGTSIRCT